MSDNKPGAGPEAASNVTLKKVYISGTDLSWALGEATTYTTKEGEKKPSKVIGIAIVKQPPPPDAPPGTPSFTMQVHVRFEDNYTDIFIVEDHLIVKNIEVSQIAVPKKTILVPQAR